MANEIDTLKPIVDVPNTAKTMFSYGFGKFAGEFFTLAFTTYVFFFYETEIGLNSLWVAAGYIIYAIWNSIDDPLLGYLTNKATRFTKKWGRRYPFIVIGSIPWVFTYILIFIPPNVDPNTEPFWLFLWLVIWSCAFDFFYSLWDVNYQSIFPDKFRDDKERRKAAGIATIVGVVGIALGSIIPPMLVEVGDRNSYIIQGAVCGLVGLTAVLCMFPGVKETPSMIQRSIKMQQQQGVEQTSFWKMLLFALKQRNVMAFLLLYFLYQSLAQSMTGSIPYFVQYILGKPQSTVTIIMAGFLVGALVSIPIWIKIAHKMNNNQRLILIGSFILAAFTAPLIFLDNYIGIIINMIFWGMGLGLFWAMTGPVFADVIDEVVVKTGKRDEGIFMGFRAFFGRLAYVVQALSFALVHTATGFINLSPTQSPLAQWGIHVHMALIPMILMILGGILFWKLNNLNPKKLLEIKAQIKELNL